VRYFKGFGSRFIELHTKLDADTLLDFAIHRRRNETRSRKNTRVKTIRVHGAVSCSRLVQYACGSVALASFPIFFFPGAVTTITVQQLSHKPCTCCKWLMRPQHTQIYIGKSLQMEQSLWNIWCDKITKKNITYKKNIFPMWLHIGIWQTFNSHRNKILYHFLHSVITEVKKHNPKSSI
jgi:hypothetical protein